MPALIPVVIIATCNEFGKAFGKYLVIVASEHLPKSGMSDAVKDNVQNALMMLIIPLLVLNLSTKIKSSNKLLFLQYSRGYDPTSVFKVNYHFPK